MLLFYLTVCTRHYWGAPLCDKECGFCSDDTVCDKITGHCPCKPGYYPPFCTKGNEVHVFMHVTQLRHYANM